LQKIAGEGTIVKIYLPRLLQDIDQRDKEEQTAESVEGSGHENILVVEDDRDVRAYLVEVLRDLNYRVLSAHDAERHAVSVSATMVAA
jgi:PleD family two-component response regulator